MDHHQSTWRSAPLWPLAILAAAAGLLSGFIAVGPVAGRPFQVLSVLLSVGSAVIVFLKPELRYRLLGLAIITAPRSVSLVAQVESHHLLFPIFLGMSAGLLAARGHMTADRETLKGADRVLFALTGLFIVANWGRALIDYYSPYIFLGTPVQDLVVAPGVSANHAFYLSQLLLLHLGGPTLFIYFDHKFRLKTEKNQASEILAGLAAGTGANLCAALLQWIGVDALWMGSGRSREAERLPGLFSDSGAATVLFPVLIAGLSIFFLSRARARNSRLLIGAAMLLIFGTLGFFEGRGYWIAAAGTLALLVPFARGAYGMVVDLDRRWPIAAIAFASFCFGGALWFATPAGRPDDRGGQVLSAAAEALLARDLRAAYRSLNRPRALQAEGGLLIVRERPFAGAGANSFMVEIRRFESTLPGIEIDNPANLPLGLASDFGLFGTGLLLILFWVCWRGRATGGSTAELYLRSLPICLGPTFLFGYHIVFAEFSALLLLPLLLPGAVAKPGDTVRKVALGTGGLCLLAFALAWWYDSNFRLPPAYWRGDRGAPPQLHPDRVVLEDSKTFFYFNGRRDFALDGVGPVRWPEADPGLMFYCYGPAGAEPVAGEPFSANGPAAARTLLLHLPESCQVRPNLEVRHREGGQFRVRAERFADGFLLSEKL